MAVFQNENAVMEDTETYNCGTLLQATLEIIFLHLISFNGCKILNRKSYVSVISLKCYFAAIRTGDSFLQDLQLVILAFHKISDRKPDSNGSMF